MIDSLMEVMMNKTVVWAGGALIVAVALDAIVLLMLV